MTDSAMTTHAQCRCARIRDLNDQLRTGHVGGRIALTRGVSQLGQDELTEVFGQLKAFSDFTNENDPYREHDLGTIEAGGQSLLWKIDYYDCNGEYGSPDPADPSVTMRVLTLMLAEEY